MRQTPCEHTEPSSAYGPFADMFPLLPGAAGQPDVAGGLAAPGAQDLRLRLFQGRGGAVHLQVHLRCVSWFNKLAMFPQIVCRCTFSSPLAISLPTSAVVPQRKNILPQSTSTNPDNAPPRRHARVHGSGGSVRGQVRRQGRRCLVRAFSLGAAFRIFFHPSAHVQPVKAGLPPSPPGN